MEVNKFIGKDYDETLKEALAKLNLTLKDVIVNSEQKKAGLFKGVQYEITITPIKDVIEYIKNYLTEIFKNMGVEASFETKIRDEQIIIKIHSDDNPLLIGHMGQNLSALQLIVRQVVKTKFGKSPYISLDVENYKDKQIMHLEKLAKRIAKEVKMSKVDAELDNMNAYERLVVHNALANFDGIYTESVGVEPNRHVVIKAKKD